MHIKCYLPTLLLFFSTTLIAQNYGYTIFKDGWSFSGTGFYSSDTSFIGGKAAYTWNDNISTGMRLGLYNTDTIFSDGYSLAPFASYRFLNMENNGELLSLALNTQYESIFFSDSIPNLNAISVGPQASYHFNWIRKHQLSLGVVWYYSNVDFGDINYDESTFGAFIRFRFNNMLLMPSFQISSSDLTDTHTGFGLSVSYVN